MGQMIGKAPIPVLAIKAGFPLSNGMYCVYGNTADEGECVDVYRDDSLKELVSMQHGIVHINKDNSKTYTLKDKIELYAGLMESMIDEF